jgi:D-alanyl-D-alanine carboxypeptidase/D-alanyl-D-alanine-endopeptidase (penicillin-binding protein 4)
MLRRLQLLTLLILGLTAPAASAADLAGTQRVLAREMALAGSASGAYVVDLDTGTPLFADDPDVQRIPASVNKLFTTATALQRFGPDHTLTTDVLAETAPDEFGVVTGDLYLRGGGDPMFSTANARALAGWLARDGLTEVTGRVIGDEAAWDGLRGGPASSYRTSSWVGPLSALSIDRGVANRRYQTEPPRTAAGILERALEREGVFIRRAARAGVVPPEATALASWTSPTVRRIVTATNVPSDNFLAESLIKALGAAFGLRGSTAAGATVVRTTVEKLGARPRIMDGSGLSRRDRTTPRDVVNLLAGMDRTEVAQPFASSLAIVGRTGTLRKRMRRTSAQDRCRAKTGTLNFVSALAGYCETTRGRRVAFAFLMNSTSVTWAHARQDRMTIALARYG